MKAKVNCGRLLKAIVNLQSSGFTVRVEYPYGSNKNVPSYINLEFGSRLKVHNSGLLGIIDNGYSWDMVEAAEHIAGLHVRLKRKDRQ